MRENPNYAVINLTHCKEQVITDPWYVLLLGSKRWPGFSNQKDITNSIFNSVFKHIHTSTIITVFFTFLSIQRLFVCWVSGGYTCLKVPNLRLSTKDNIRSPNRISNDVKPHKGGLRGGDSVSQIGYAILFGVQNTQWLWKANQRTFQSRHGTIMLTL